MLGRSGGGANSRGGNAARRAFFVAGALTLATLGAVACADDGKDAASNDGTNSTVPTTQGTAAPSNGDDALTHEGLSTAVSAESATQGTATSDTDAMAATVDDSSDHATSEAQTSSGAQTSTNGPSSSDGEGDDNPSAWPAAEGPDYAFARGGTRLGAVHFRAASAERFLHFYDRKLARECAFEKIAGKNGYACAPVVPIVVHYLDAACTQPIVLSQNGAISAARPAGSSNDPLVPVPQDFVGSLVTTRDELSCSLERNRGLGPDVIGPGSDLPARGDVTAVYQVGEGFALTPDDDGSTLTTVFKLTDGTCAGTSALVRIRDPADSAYLLAPRAVDELVTAHVQTFDAGAKFDVQRLIASDGSWQTLAPIDHLGEACELIEDGRCVPGPIAPLTHATLFPSFPCYEPAVDVLVSGGRHCGERYGMATTGETRVFELVAGEDSGYFQQSQKLDPDTGELLGVECGGFGSDWVAKEEAAREFFSAESILVGTAALRARATVAQRTAVSLRRDVDFLLEDDTVCDVNVFDDGLYRCHLPTPGVLDGVTYLPENRVQTAGSNLYGDADCVQHIYIEQSGANPDMPFWNLTTSFHAMLPFDGLLYEDHDGVCYPLEGTSIGNLVFVEADELPIALPIVEKTEL